MAKKDGQILVPAPIAIVSDTLQISFMTKKNMLRKCLFETQTAPNNLEAMSIVAGVEKKASSFIFI